MTISRSSNIFLADDDDDDCLFFQEALNELSEGIQLTITHNGEQLMNLLTEMTGDLPRVLFLDLNMPRKNGFQCLTEIKQHQRLKELPVIIFSTSFERKVADLLYQNGAQYFIPKPAAFEDLKKVIHRAIQAMDATLSSIPIEQVGNFPQPSKEDFVLN